jgi:chorismate mutase / prephenate dehydratase
MAGSDDPLPGLRDAIDRLDDTLLDLLNERARLVAQVAEHKQATGRAFYVPARERAIIDRLQERNAGPFPSSAIRPVFQEVISACLSLEKGQRVAFLGPEATFAHQAVTRHFGTSAVTIPCGAIPAVFEEVDRGLADFGVVPVENSTEGVVTHTLDTFIDSDLRICGEIAIDVDQCLLAQPGVTEGTIERVYSHPQGLAQCRGWLTANLPRATRIECPSTSDAARRAQEDPRGAAIAAELAARTWRLEVLRRSLQDVAVNVTRFLVIGKRPQDPPAAAVAGENYKTTLLLALPDQAGSLFRVLQPLHDGGVNMTKIESRPTRRQLWDYVFFIDLDGHCDEPHVQAALAAMRAASRLFKVLGSYRKADIV